jgi:hypothetical protein
MNTAKGKENAAEKNSVSSAKEGKNSAQGSQKAGASGVKKPLLPESARKPLFALLALIAIGAAAYVLLMMPAQDSPADGSEFYARLVNSSNVAILCDVRGVTDDAQQSAIYQCRVDMISKGRFVGKTLVNIGCDSDGCISATAGTNGSNTLTYEQAQKEMSAMPYIIIKPSAQSGYSFYQRHMEIAIAPNITDWTGCDISAKES